MSSDLSAEITAIATAALALFAIITAVYAVRAFRKQSQDVRDQASMLKLQSEQLDEQRKINERQTKVLDLQASELRESLEERKRDTAERRRAQASRVFIWIQNSADQHTGHDGIREPFGITAHIKNTSEQPVYNLVIDWNRKGAPWRRRDPFPVLMPGGQETGFLRLPDYSGAFFDTQADVAKLRWPVARFRDAAGTHWLLRPDGHLDEQPDRQLEEAQLEEAQFDDQPATGQPDADTP
jgi:hypothetical protein